MPQSVQSASGSVPELFRDGTPSGALPPGVIGFDEEAGPLHHSLSSEVDAYT